MKFLLSLLVTCLGLFSLTVSASAQDYGLNATADAAGLSKYEKNVPTLIGNVVGTALSMIAVIFFVLMVYGGFLWMTAHGHEDQITKAKDTIIAAVIGIIVVLGSYAVTNFVFDSVQSGGGPAGGQACGADSDASCQGKNVAAQCGIPGAVPPAPIVGTCKFAQGAACNCRP